MTLYHGGGIGLRVRPRVKDMFGLILKENSFQFLGTNFPHAHGTAMGTKMAVAFDNIFMSNIEEEIISQSNTKPREWKRCIDDMFALWDSNIQEITLLH